MSKNKNIQILKNLNELSEEIDFNTYEHKELFSLMAYLIPNKEQEKLELEIVDEENSKKTGFIYALVVGDKIFKIGQSTGTLKSRVSSYNCGKIEYRISGTNSTTNYFVLQSLLSINEKVSVYVYFPPLATYEIFGEKIKSSESPSKFIERKILADFIKTYNKKPIGCTQK